MALGIERMAANLTAPVEDEIEAILYPNSNLNPAIERNKVIINGPQNHRRYVSQDASLE